MAVSASTSIWKKGEAQYLLEVKGCMLEIDGVSYFPDAPTERCVKHLRKPARAVIEGYRAAVAFVIQMDGITEVQQNTNTHSPLAQRGKRNM